MHGIDNEDQRQETEIGRITASIMRGKLIFALPRHRTAVRFKFITIRNTDAF